MNMNTFVAYEICPRNTICNKYIISKKWNIIKVKLLVKHFIDRLYRGYHTIYPSIMVCLKEISNEKSLINKL